MKNLKRKSASILLIVTVIASSAMMLFLTISFMAKQYLQQISSLEYANLAENYAESGMEEAIVRYFEKSEEKYEDYKKNHDESVRRKEILYGAIIDNENQESNKKIEKNIYLNYKMFGFEDQTKIGEVEVKASRLVDKIEGKLYPFQKFEFRLTAEEREKYKYRGKDWHQSDIKQLKLVWNGLNGDTNDKGISVLQIRWPIGQKGNIQTHQINFDHGGNFTFGDFGTETGAELSELTLPTDEEYGGNFSDLDDKYEKYEYIYILKAKTKALAFEIYGLDENGNKIKLPDKNVYFEVKSQIGGDKFDLGGENSGRSFTKFLKAKKEIYTNFDSSFDYGRVFIGF
ncbi:hypothetical protein LR002_00945 [Candidatus Gracilibacteria bacterium]|nr:hypothetical protein [Candidatus Gracilibacteria bacterium]